MSDVDTAAEDTEPDISFFIGSEPYDKGKTLKAIKEKVSEFINVKNVSFLLGAGTSSSSIPSMKAMSTALREAVKVDPDLKQEEKELFENIKQDNLEDTLNILYAKKSYLEGAADTDKDEEGYVDKLIEYIEDGMFSSINVDLTESTSEETLELYKLLYQKVALRNKDLSRVNIFTTNNDLFNEKALDTLNINYNNGFGGGLDRMFNPARFHYTFSKKIDPNLEKFEPLDNMVYLYKLHGSISWVERDGDLLFNIHEIPIAGGQDKPESGHYLIYPTPLKQSQSLGSPYSDLIREFQTKLSQPNSVLFIIGYSFSDDHLNNIIYQSMASNSSISIVIFGEHSDCPLVKINDSRIFRIFGEIEPGTKIHYFEQVVKQILPNPGENKEKELLERFSASIKDAIRG